MGTTFIPDPTSTSLQRAREQSDARNEARFGSIRNRPKTQVSQEQFNYLQRQVNNISASGGTEEDVLNFLQSEGIATPKPVSIDRMNEPQSGLAKARDFTRGLSQRALQGVTFGFGDEAIGALEGILSGAGARAGIDNYRNELEQWSRDHGKTGFAAEIAGSLLTGGLLLKAGKGIFAGAKAGVTALRGGQAAHTTGSLANVATKASLLQKTGGAVGQGALGGAISGAGHAEGNVVEQIAANPAVLLPGGEKLSLSETTRGVLWGTALGGAFGGGLVGGGLAAGGLVRTVARAATRGKDPLRKLIPGVSTPARHARERLREALAQDNVSIEEAVKRATELRAQGIAPTVADLGGKATFKLGRDGLSTRNPASQKLSELIATRQGEQGERMAASFFSRIFRHNRMGLRNSYDAEDLLQAERARVSAQLYPEAYKHNVQLTDRLKEILQRPIFRQAWAKGKDVADAEDFAGMSSQGALKVPALPEASGAAGLAARLQAGAGSRPLSPTVQQQLAKLGDQFPDELPIRGLDNMKQELDNIIRGLQRSTENPMSKKQARILVGTLSEALDEVDTQVMSYARARAAFRGSIELEEAIVTGRDFLKMGKAPEIIARELRDLSPSERDFYRMGAAQAIFDKVGGFGEKADVADFLGGRLFANRNNQMARKIRALFPEAPEAADDFMRQVSGESRVSLTSREFAGARPIGRSVQLGEQAVEGGPTPSVRASPGLTLLGAGRQALERLRSRWTEDVSDELAVLFSKGIENPDELTGLLLSLESLGGAANKIGGSARAAVTIGEVAGQIP